MRRHVLVTIIVATSAVVACSDDPSGSDQVCDARDDLAAEFDDVVDDVRAGNLGDAQDELDEVGSAWDELQSGLGDLGDEQREALAPETEALQADVEALGDVDSLDELGSSIDTIVDDAQGIFDQISEALDCE